MELSTYCLALLLNLLIHSTRLFAQETPCDSNFVVSAAVSSRSVGGAIVFLFVGNNYWEFNPQSDNIVTRNARSMMDGRWQNFPGNQTVRLAFMDSSSNIILVTASSIIVYSTGSDANRLLQMASVNLASGWIANDTVAIFTVASSGAANNESRAQGPLNVVRSDGSVRICQNLDFNGTLSQQTEAIVCSDVAASATQVITAEDVQQVNSFQGRRISAAAYVNLTQTQEILFFNRRGLCKYRLSTKQCRDITYTNTYDCSSFPAFAVALILAVIFGTILCGLLLCGYLFSQHAKKRAEREAPHKPKTLRTNPDSPGTNSENTLDSVSHEAKSPVRSSSPQDKPKSLTKEAAKQAKPKEARTS